MSSVIISYRYTIDISIIQFRFSNVFNFNLSLFLNGQDSTFCFFLFGICTVLNGPDEFHIIIIVLFSISFLYNLFNRLSFCISHAYVMYFYMIKVSRRSKLAGHHILL